MTTTPGPTDVTVQEAAEQHAAGVPLLDVREPDEWSAVHVATATSAPLSSLSLDDVPPGGPVLVICHLGGRSARAAQALANAGIETRNVLGGMDAWEKAGLPVTRG